MLDKSNEFKNKIEEIEKLYTENEVRLQFNQNDIEKFHIFNLKNPTKLLAYDKS